MININVELQKLYLMWDGKCTECGMVISSSETAELGYKNNGKPFYACTRCGRASGEVVWSITGRSVEHESADNDLIIWRYLSIDRFFDLILFRRIPFIRLNVLGDPFEGSMSINGSPVEWYERLKNIKKSILSRFPQENTDGSITEPLSGNKLEQEIDKWIEKYKNHCKQYSLINYVSCWHESADESNAMWELYHGDVAIKSTVKNFKASLNYPWNLRASKVKYIKYKENYFTDEFRAFYKRKEFSHEKEVRFLLQDLNPKDIGPCQYIESDLKSLINTVVISPNAEQWQKDLLVHILPININLKESSLSEEPFHG